MQDIIVHIKLFNKLFCLVKVKLKHEMTRTNKRYSTAYKTKKWSRFTHVK